MSSNDENSLPESPRGRGGTRRTGQGGENRSWNQLRDRFGGLIEALSDWYWVIDEKGQYSFVSAAARPVLGYEARDLLGRPFYELIRPQEQNRLKEAVLRAMSARAPIKNLAKPVLHRDGRLVILEMTGLPLLDENGQFKGYHGADRDITNRIRTEESLRASEVRLRAILNTAVDGIVTIDETGTINDFNPAAELIFGYSRGEAIGQNVSFLMPEPDRSRHDTYILNYLESNYPKVIGRTREVLARRKEGQVFPVEVSVSEIRQGARRLFTGMVRDISERKKAEEQLQMFAQIFENSLEGIFVTDAQGKIVTVNPAFSEITGYSAEEVMGQTPGVLRSDRHPPEFYQSIWATLAQEGRWQGEIWDRRKTGEAYPQWQTTSAIRDAQGRVTHYVAVFNDISEIKHSQERIRHQAFHDPLTGLPNRLLFSDRLTMALSHARRNKKRAAVLFLDLDRFKHVNDSLGHAAGDLLLQGVAQRLRNILREKDTIARLGGDEFTVIIEELEDPAGAVSVAEKILAALTEPFNIKDHDIYAPTSIGITVFPDDGVTPEALIKNADLAMYRAKELGRNNYQLYTPDLNLKAVQHLSLEAKLRRALENEEFVIHYQPVIGIGSGRVSRVEALIRWRQDHDLLDLPQTFLPLAEETGLIVPLGRWVLRTALKQVRSWQKSGRPDLGLAVNLSLREMEQLDSQALLDLIQNLDFNPTLLTLELGPACLGKTEAVRNHLEALREVGIHLTADDFGTCPSALEALSDLPLDALKIGRSLVSGLPQDAARAGIVAAIVTLARNLNLTPVAVGVETQPQLDFFQSHGGMEAQGFLFAPPMPAPEMAVFLGLA